MAYFQKIISITLVVIAFILGNCGNGEDVGVLEDEPGFRVFFKNDSDPGGNGMVMEILSLTEEPEPYKSLTDDPQFLMSICYAEGILVPMSYYSVEDTTLNDSIVWGYTDEYGRLKEQFLVGKDQEIVFRANFEGSGVSDVFIEIE